MVIWRHQMLKMQQMLLLMVWTCLDGKLEHQLSRMDINIPQNRYTKWFDYDKIEKSLVLRTRQKGDFLTIDDRFSRKSIQDYMVNEKIPRAIREEMPLLCEENHVLWVPGYRISSFYKINENTKYILQVQLRGGQIDVGTY